MASLFSMSRFFSNTSSSSAPVYKPIVQTLVTYLDNHPTFKADFETAFRKAKTLGIKGFDSIQTLDDYLKFYDDCLEWVPVEDASAKAVFYRFSMFYIVLDLLPSKYQTPITPEGGWTWLSQWIVDYAQEVGKWMDDPRSITEASIATFYESKAPAPRGYHMQDYIRPMGGWKTFNQFFARHIDAKVRPIYKPDDSTAIVSPADSTFVESVQIATDSTVQFVSPKGVPWSISELLHSTIFGERFKGGQLMHVFLSTTDYHRMHAPVSGRIVEAKMIPGSCYVEVIVVQGSGGNELKMHRNLRRVPSEMRDQASDTFDAPNNAGYQFLQARGLIIIDNDELGLVAVMPIGMAVVSSVVFTENVKVGSYLKKGDEFSYFQFGGSDIIMVFEAKANVDFSKTEKIWHPVGGLIATAYPKKS